MLAQERGSRTRRSSPSTVKVRLAAGAATEAERAAANAQVVRILGSLALYYLPDVDRGQLER